MKTIGLITFFSFLLIGTSSMAQTYQFKNSTTQTLTVRFYEHTASSCSTAVTSGLTVDPNDTGIFSAPASGNSYYKCEVAWTCSGTIYYETVQISSCGGPTSATTSPCSFDVEITSMSGFNVHAY